MISALNIKNKMDEISGKHCSPVEVARVNDQVVRMSYMDGEFHWHKHDHEDEFFYVIDGLLHIDIEDKIHDLQPGQGFVVPKGVIHRTRAPQRTSILMVEGKTVSPTGD